MTKKTSASSQSANKMLIPDTTNDSSVFYRIITSYGMQTISILSIIYLFTLCFSNGIEIPFLKTMWNEYVLRNSILVNLPISSAWHYFLIVIFGTQMLHFTTFWLHCGILAIIDFFPSTFSYLRQWKIQKDKNDPLDSSKFIHCLLVVLRNQVFVNIGIALLTYPLFKYQELSISVEDLPNVQTIASQFILFLIVEEIGFFYGHKLMHSPAYYKKYHKIHHEWTSPVGCAAIYAHPLEHALCNLLPVIVGPLLVSAHVATYWIWLTLAVFTSITHHSGYHFPFLASSEFHDFHHLNFNSNFGVLEILDTIYGTDAMFQGSPQQKRNFVFTSLSDVQKMDAANKSSNKVH